MGIDRDETRMLKEKRGLIFTMLKRRFEDQVYDYLCKDNFSDMDALDDWLDKALEQYYKECEAIDEYYDERLNS